MLLWPALLIDAPADAFVFQHLVGSKNFCIFETYLDQGRTALRILWTEVRECNGLRGILVWYVSKHKHVSKYMLQIGMCEIV